ncbi:MULTISPECIES: glycoside hydrolase family 75 protein [Streptomyces]|uniref:Glycoside hydrolase family 75 protein n=1 Tax=Streptomyces ortus TaxID=2867268 RepID=A0ABT3UVI9_9ACTN|nr:MULTISPECIES: glycoside hydrolase family 75 protein [Streptomyces]MCX4231575.1 glycoside hydrolase family 75 protein [Streptomyces ortus]
MRVRSLMLAAAGAALISPSVLPGAAPPPDAGHERAAYDGPGAGRVPRAGAPADAPRAPSSTPRPTPSPGNVAAAELLAAVRDCDPVSDDRFSSDDGEPADIEVCGRREAVFWKADLDVDCDGRPGRHCNERTDPLFCDTTAFQQSDGRQLSAERLPYVVVPGPSHRWNHREHDVRRGTVAAVIHGDRVRYAVVGDIGPEGIIGEASYALARNLGIRPDPKGGGAASGVTYILFKGSGASPIESPAAAEAQGERLARALVGRS